MDRRRTARRSSDSSRRRRRVERMREIAEHGSGFVYLISRLGVTGMRDDLPPELPATVQRLREATTLPVCVGFGVSRPEQAAAVARIADGVVVGSAIVRAAGESVDDGRRPRGVAARRDRRRLSRRRACDEITLRGDALSRARRHSAARAHDAAADRDRPARSRRATAKAVVDYRELYDVVGRDHSSAVHIDFLEEIADRVARRRARAQHAHSLGARRGAEAARRARRAARVCRGRRRATRGCVDVAYIALGSNLGDRHALSRERARGAARLPERASSRESSIEETAPLGRSISRRT